MRAMLSFCSFFPHFQNYLMVSIMKIMKTSPVTSHQQAETKSYPHFEESGLSKCFLFS